MWSNNHTVTMTYTSAHTTNGWVLLSGLNWMRIKAHSPDGTTNCLGMLNAAKANSKLVDVYIVSNEVERIVLR